MFNITVREQQRIWSLSLGQNPCLQEDTMNIL